MMSLLVTPLRYTPCGQRQADWSWARRGTADREGGFDFSRIRCRPGPTAIKDADVPVGGGIASWKQTGKGSIDPKESFRGKPGLRLENRTPDHSMANQIVAVRPNTRHRVSAFVKTEGNQLHEKGRDGACLGIRGTFQKSDPLPTDSDWTLVVFEFDSQDRREVEIGPHLGWHGSIVHGRCFG